MRVESGEVWYDVVWCGVVRKYFCAWLTIVTSLPSPPLWQLWLWQYWELLWLTAPLLSLPSQHHKHQHLNNKLSPSGFQILHNISKPKQPKMLIIFFLWMLSNMIHDSLIKILRKVWFFRLHKLQNKHKHTQILLLYMVFKMIFDIILLMVVLTIFFSFGFCSNQDQQRALLASLTGSIMSMTIKTVSLQSKNWLLFY